MMITLSVYGCLLFYNVKYMKKYNSFCISLWFIPYFYTIYQVIGLKSILKILVIMCIRNIQIFVINILYVNKYVLLKANTI